MSFHLQRFIVYLFFVEELNLSAEFARFLLSTVRFWSSHHYTRKKKKTAGEEKKTRPNINLWIIFLVTFLSSHRVHSGMYSFSLFDIYSFTVQIYLKIILLVYSCSLRTCTFDHSKSSDDKSKFLTIGIRTFHICSLVVKIKREWQSKIIYFFSLLFSI